MKTSKPQRLPLMMCGDLGMLDPQLDKPPEAGNAQFPWAPLRAQLYFRPASKLQVAGHTSTQPQQKGPSPAPRLVCAQFRQLIGAMCLLLLEGRLSACSPPALTATWHLRLGLHSSLELPRFQDVITVEATEVTWGQRSSWAGFQGRARKGAFTWVLP